MSGATDQRHDGDKGAPGGRDHAVSGPPEGFAAQPAATRQVVLGDPVRHGFAADRRHRLPAVRRKLALQTVGLQGSPRMLGGVAQTRQKDFSASPAAVAREMPMSRSMWSLSCIS
jgi:hypothetical protein